MNARTLGVVMVLFVSGCGSDDEASSVSNECVLEASRERTKGDDYYVVEAGSPVLATDPQTGLTWARCSLGQSNTGTSCGGTGTIVRHTWSQALGAARTANQKAFEGHTDWRLPNVKELSSLVDTACANVTMNTEIFPGVTRSEYWSSSPNVDRPSDAWAVDFATGRVRSAGKTTKSFPVRLVRGGD
ncbi:DUF1566 domain-containing protein [Halofilum ochraceum]|uniref:Lcl C-terminal domain-containing protein n=1 Tax=Halofilum ochraceum TaxID=1611323 RepID=UPI00082C8390|nr:DUF1566 domain-containing protein [Halofilum ochraceum]